MQLADGALAQVTNLLNTAVTLATESATGTVSNGEQLIVLDRTRRWVKVQTASGGVGWIEERLTVPQGVEEQFEALRLRARELDYGRVAERGAGINSAGSGLRWPAVRRHRWAT